ncbi:sodium ion-translocating decarboxylase subunit beta, partial [Escherichia coli]|nr:sodium ion-translocating decarboxylase subunit beta [Escherichia coli]
KKYRGMEVDIDYPTVSKKAKFIFTICACLLLCLLLPVAAPLILSFFLGIAIKEAEIEPFQKLLESTMTYTATLFLGLLLGTLCEAQTILDPKVGIILILGIGALAISAVGALLGGWFIWFISKGRYNPAIGIAGVSCL